MPHKPQRTRSLAGTRARIVDLIRRKPMTAREIAEQLGMTYHAVRLHLIALERDATLRVVGERGSTRPASVYDIGAGVESALSNAYVPFASHLTSVLAERLPKRQLDGIMRDVGRRLASSFPRPRGTLRERALAASTLLQEMGAPNEVVQEDVLRIRSSSCLLSEAIHGRPEVCNSVATFLGELLGADVRQCCIRGDRPRCCFEIRRAS
jgi:predicted ArsR family transcriptional regulator